MSQQPRSENSVPEEFQMFLGLFDDGLASSEVEHLKAQLAQNPEAQAYFAESLALQNGIEHFNLGSRQFCPTPEKLYSLAAKMLGAAESAELRRHIAVCPFCAEDYQDLVALLQPPALELAFAWVDQSLTLLKEQLGSLLLTTEPELALARSASAKAQSWAVVHKAAGAELSVETTHSNERWVVQLRLKRGDRFCRFSALLFQNDQVIEGAVTDSEKAPEIGVAFEIDVADKYELTIQEMPPSPDDSWTQTVHEDGQNFHETLSLKLA